LIRGFTLPGLATFQPKFTLWQTDPATALVKGPAAKSFSLAHALMRASAYKPTPLGMSC